MSGGVDEDLVPRHRRIIQAGHARPRHMPTMHRPGTPTRMPAEPETARVQHVPPQTRQRSIEHAFTIVVLCALCQRGVSPPALRTLFRSGPATRRRCGWSRAPSRTGPRRRRRGLLQPLPTRTRRSRRWCRRGLGCPFSTRRHCGHDRARPGRGRLGHRARDLPGDVPGDLPGRPGLMNTSGLLLQRGDLQRECGQRRGQLNQRRRRASPGLAESAGQIPQLACCPSRRWHQGLRRASRPIPPRARPVHKLLLALIERGEHVAGGMRQPRRLGRIAS